MKKKPKVTVLVSKSKKRDYKPAVMLDLGSRGNVKETTDKRFKRITKSGKNNDIYARVGSNILSLRMSQSLSIKQLAAKAGIPASYLSNIENGKRKATLYTIEKIANALKTDIRDLVGLEVKDDGLTDKEFFSGVLAKQGKLVYTKIRN